MRLEIEVPDPPAGWEYTGEYRQPAMDEPYEVEGEAVISEGECGQYLILRRVSQQTIEVDESLIPAGFRATGFGKPRAGQWYEHCGAAHQAFNDFRTDKHLLLEKIEPVRESRWRRMPVNKDDTGMCCLWDSKEKAGWRCGFLVERLEYEGNKLVAVALEPLGEGGGE